MTNHEEKTTSRILAINIIQYFTLFLLIYSGTCLIMLGFSWLFNPQNFYHDAFFGHLYGFICSNIVLLISQHGKNRLTREEDV
jgi:hypothetical protein